ncbi:LysR substrate-binding domain-containing protein [Serratia marcescens]|uniref:LysR substrate-binding domain-containing protein n=1 Tax=Serratia marcescens TaxID=615 RepID=UPI001F5BD111|nr:LysR substrate-binding domain-containing protein [Serratia marcescens]
MHHARVLLQQRDRLRGDMAEFAPGQRSQLRIVANTVAADAFLPELLADFLMLHPHTDIALEELPSPAIAQAIAERAADIGIVADHADLRGLTSYPFRQDRLVLALPPGHALSGRRQVSFADALPFDFIGLPEESALQQHLEQLAIRSGGPMRLRARAAHFDAICRMVLRGAGLAVVPEESAQRQPEIRHSARRLTTIGATPAPVDRGCRTLRSCRCRRSGWWRSCAMPEAAQCVPGSARSRATCASTSRQAGLSPA